MTYEQFWNDEPDLVIYYREAYKIQESRINSHAWIQGNYIREALHEVVSKYITGKTSTTYPNQPYAITKEEQKKRDDEERNQRLEAMRQSLLKQCKKQ